MFYEPYFIGEVLSLGLSWALYDLFTDDDDKSSKEDGESPEDDVSLEIPEDIVDGNYSTLNGTHGDDSFVSDGDFGEYELYQVINLYAGDDVAEVGDAGWTTINGGAGNDTLSGGTAVAYSTVLNGEAGDDHLILDQTSAGDEPSAYAFGGDGDDTLSVTALPDGGYGSGQAYLTGGNGADTFEVDINRGGFYLEGAETDAPADGIYVGDQLLRITDFEIGEDVLVIDPSSIDFTKVTDDEFIEEELHFSHIQIVEKEDGSSTTLRIISTSDDGAFSVANTIQLDGTVGITSADIRIVPLVA